MGHNVCYVMLCCVIFSPLHSQLRLNDTPLDCGLRRENALQGFEENEVI